MGRSSVLTARRISLPHRKRKMLDKMAAERIEELRLYAGREANDVRAGGR
jgi:hypothetical protein